MVVAALVEIVRCVQRHMTRFQEGVLRAYRIRERYESWLAACLVMARLDSSFGDSPLCSTPAMVRDGSCAVEYRVLT
jgi:hypothetical protein